MNPFLLRRVVRHSAALLLIVACAVLFVAGGPAATTTWSYVAMGDSYSSGVGTGSYTLDSACRRSVYAYPYLFTQKHSMGSFDFVACSGAKTTDLIAKQLPSLKPTTNLVTMTIGGNDIGFASLIQQCTVSDCSSTLVTTKSNLGSTLAPALNTAFAAVKQAAPNATVIVLGYPRVFSTSTCFGTLGISSTEEKNANALADAVDTVTSSYAGDLRLHVQERHRPLDRPRGLLVESVAERAQPVQHRRELPPHEGRPQRRVPSSRHGRHRLAVLPSTSQPSPPLSASARGTNVCG